MRRERGGKVKAGKLEETPRDDHLSLIRHRGCAMPAFLNENPNETSGGGGTPRTLHYAATLGNARNGVRAADRRKAKRERGTKVEWEERKKKGETAGRGGEGD